jgi:metal-responsive CopG/Arc/MetJ family transcriptional regulator
MYSFHIIGMKRLILRVDLDAKLSKELKEIREHLGLENYTETIRYLIREKYREIKPTEKSENFVTPVTVQGDG